MTMIAPPSSSRSTSRLPSPTRRPAASGEGPTRIATARRTPSSSPPAPSSSSGVPASALAGPSDPIIPPAMPSSSTATMSQSSMTTASTATIEAAAPPPPTPLSLEPTPTSPRQRVAPTPLPPLSPRSNTDPPLRPLTTATSSMSPLVTSSLTSTPSAASATTSNPSRTGTRSTSHPRPARIISPPTPRDGRSNEPGGKLILDKYAVYETNLKIYVIACNQSDSRYRVLKIDRSAPTVPSKTSDEESETTAGEDGHQSEPAARKEHVTVEEQGGLVLTEDDTIYSRDEIELLKETLSAGNAGGLRRVEGLFYGIIGFIRFTGPYYMILIKRRQHVALIGGHYIYHCEEAVVRPISLGGGSTKTADEARRLHAFQGVDLSKNFYFAYTYDVTNTLQHNLTRAGGEAKKSALAGLAGRKEEKATAANDPLAKFNDKWVWNRFLLRPAFSSLKENSPWILPLIHGFVDQAKLSIFGRTVYITLIARRSRHFAGARFLKRGVNEQGYVANDVETEQIVSDALTTSFHAPAPASHHHPATGERHQNRKPNPRFTSFVQVRGSIPLFWSQESINMSPKPPIELTIVDPYFSAAALHFDDLLGRYGGPITVLNLIKQKERAPRESKLLPEFKQCIDYLNQFLPNDHKVEYIAWDLAAANKKRDKDVIGVLEDIAEESLERTKFFHTGPEPTWFNIYPDASHPGEYRSTPLLQSGVVRTNCIDCLDRTNAAQFVIAKAALGHQLHALGILDYPNLPFESDAVNMIMEMFHDHGDTVALQYGGSHLVNTMETYRGIAQWTSHSRDIVNNLRRYYTNSFVDADKQAAIDVFLGIQAPASPLPRVLYSHSKTRRSYRDWYTPDHLKPSLTPNEAERRLRATVEEDDASGSANYWQAFYRPQLLTQFDKHFAIIMNSTSKYPKAAAWTSDGPDASPFVARHSTHAPQHRLLAPSKSRAWSGARGAGVGYSRPTSSLRSRIRAQRIDEGSSTTGTIRSKNSSSLVPTYQPNASSHGIVSTPIPTTTGTSAGASGGTATEHFVQRLLEPRVEPVEAREYASWVDQFRHLSLAQELSDKDRALYKTHARLAGAPLLTSAAGEETTWEDEHERGSGDWGNAGVGDEEDEGMVRLKVEAVNLRLYEEMVRISRPVAALGGGSGGVAGADEVAGPGSSARIGGFGEIE